ncbi:hypothetical protein BV898_11592 [Hypsibius exemplaris]|uniref:Uncharacterized protein n=1 Tax=Hypsibius exemplaris TaxID=2072580 RepID=A0A1W0WGB3_HYPEX|nr:hypothetical protein BV898_11592 [Hypsibius exemplaris]
MSEQTALLSQLLGRLSTDENDQSSEFASSISERARKRSERTEEDRKQTVRLDQSRRRIANYNSARF